MKDSAGSVSRVALLGQAQAQVAHRQVCHELESVCINCGYRRNGYKQLTQHERLEEFKRNWKAFHPRMQIPPKLLGRVINEAEYEHSF